MSALNEERRKASFLRQRAEDALRGKPVDLAGLPIEDIQNLLYELQVHQVELTLQNEELRRVQLEIAAARDQYSNLYNFAPVGYCTLDYKDHILEANQTLAAMLAIGPEKLVHKKLSEFVYREDQDKYYLHHQRTIQDHQQQMTDLQMVKQAEGRFDVRLVSVIDHADPAKIQVILSDITERRRVEKDLEHYTQELEIVNQALREFSVIVSHDLQEPLRKVIGFGKLLETQYGEVLDTDGKNYLTRMISATLRMDVLLQGLLAYTRISSRDVPFADVDLQQIAVEVLSDLDERIKETGGKVELGDLPTIQADPLQMRQLFQNLISNALKYHRPGEPPLIRVTSSTDVKNKIKIVVEDNGIGIDMQYADHIFQPFTRLGGKPDISGNGMGLAICKKIVERHHGTISVSSEVGQGSVFTVTFPISNQYR